MQSPSPADLIQLLYVSRACAPFDEPGLQQVIGRSQSNNAALGITGALLYCDSNFLQMLEGDGEVVMNLYQKIALDPRHTGCDVLLCKPVKKRQFPDWRMRLINLSTQLTLDRHRMQRLMDDIRARTNTRAYGVEARLLLNDFAAQVQAA